MNTPPPEVTLVEAHRVWCDGSTDIRSGARYRPAALGHPKVFLEIDEHGYVDCGYCDRRFILRGGPAEGVDQASLADISEGGDPGHA
ncbi:MAG: zinc-finger domain-containing protein [Altererythrobacter sp.]|nr:zinc-finger domain-containing protein [Altererythrobacter sp.]